MSNQWSCCTSSCTQWISLWPSSFCCYVQGDNQQTENTPVRPAIGRCEDRVNKYGLELCKAISVSHRRVCQGVSVHGTKCTEQYLLHLHDIVEGQHNQFQLTPDRVYVFFLINLSLTLQ